MLRPWIARVKAAHEQFVEMQLPSQELQDREELRLVDKWNSLEQQRIVFHPLSALLRRFIGRREEPISLSEDFLIGAYYRL